MSGTDHSQPPLHAACPKEQPPGESPSLSDPDTILAELALRYQQGDREALALLHERLRPAIFATLGRLLRRPLPGPIAAEDLQQQSWIVLGELAGRWRPTGSFLAYFVRTFERELRRYVARAQPVRGRRAIRVLAIPHDQLLGVIERRHVADDTAERATLFLDQLAILTQAERVAVLLHVLEEQDFGAIGRQLQVSRATAHRLYRRGLARLAVPDGGSAHA